mmetsp:Transcript_8546/g.25848  ORF Transcript_8546/g.25848 Transcript_8546/m.25848 type:complete len:224 (-) Transcript_8546:343-1014(-)
MAQATIPSPMPSVAASQKLLRLARRLLGAADVGRVSPDALRARTAQLSLGGDDWRRVLVDRRLPRLVLLGATVYLRVGHALLPGGGELRAAFSIGEKPFHSHLRTRPRTLTRRSLEVQRDTLRRRLPLDRLKDLNRRAFVLGQREHRALGQLNSDTALHPRPVSSRQRRIAWQEALRLPGDCIFRAPNAQPDARLRLSRLEPHSHSLDLLRRILRASRLREHG